MLAFRMLYYLQGAEKAQQSSWGARRKAKREGKTEGRRRLREAIAEHDSWQPAAASRLLRFTDQLDPSGETVPQASAYLLLHCNSVLPWCRPRHTQERHTLGQPWTAKQRPLLLCFLCCYTAALCRP